jgi:hypothetical protein
MGTGMSLREHHFPIVYVGVMQWTSSRGTRKSQQKNLCTQKPADQLDRLLADAEAALEESAARIAVRRGRV